MKTPFREKTAERRETLDKRHSRMGCTRNQTLIFPRQAGNIRFSSRYPGRTCCLWSDSCNIIAYLVPCVKPLISQKPGLAGQTEKACPAQTKRVGKANSHAAGRSRETRTPGLSILKRYRKVFSAYRGFFQHFLLGKPCSSALLSAYIPSTPKR